MAEKHKRFAHYSKQEIEKKQQEATPKSTLKCNKKWNLVFRNYLQEKELENTEYWTYPDDELDDILASFWFEVRTNRSSKDEIDENDKAKKAKVETNDQYPEYYSIASMRNLRNGLSRELQNHGRMINLTTDPKFVQLQKAFKDACKELKQKGKGLVKSYPEILHSGMLKTKLKVVFFTQFTLKFNIADN